MAHAPDLSGHALDDRYELHELIGEGAFGRVYRGRDRRLARAVAVKVIKPWWSEDPAWVQSFGREAQLLARVSDPGIVQIYDVGKAAEGTYYVEELVEGESLAERLRRGALPPREACELAGQLCFALAQAHARGVVHRDVKPANVLISSDGRVKVGDFGVALLAEGTSDAALQAVVGTPRYMAPEQARGDVATPATDVYSVGVILYEMLCGRPPFTGTSSVEVALRHLQDPPPSLGLTVPEPLQRIVLRALAKGSDERYATAGAMAEALARAARVHGNARLRGAPGDTAIKLSPVAGDEVHAGRSRRFAPASAEDEPGPAGTRVAPRLGPRRNLNPPARRRTLALFAVVLSVLLAMLTGGILLAQPPTIRVPDLRGLTQARASARADQAGLRPSFMTRFDEAPRGVAVAQLPGPGAKRRSGAPIDVVLSAGPPPVKVPRLQGESAADARTVLSSLGLDVQTTPVPAPGVSPGTVTQQSPGAAAELPPGSSVTLSVAEIPQWRSITSMSGEGAAHSVPFRIRGTRWRIVYSMGYDGTCTFLFICSGPSAHIATLGGGSTGNAFDLNEGEHESQKVDLGAGIYQITVSPGSDTAHWSMRIDDYY